MKTFICKLKQLVAHNTLAPRDVLFKAELPFLRTYFYPCLREVIQPKDGSPYVFVCKVPTKVSLDDFLRGLHRREWGDFYIKSIKIDLKSTESHYMTIRVGVDCTGNTLDDKEQENDADSES